MHPARPVRPARTPASPAAPRRLAAACASAFALAALPVGAAPPGAPPGASAESLLEVLRESSPDLAAARLDAQAAAERAVPAGALPDPRLRVELRDFTNAGRDASPSLLPGRVGSTKYTFMQTLPFFGKRDARREAAVAEGEAAARRADGTWLDLATRAKTAYAQYYFSSGNLRLTREVLDLVARLEGVAQARYAAGLAAQQDVIRAQVEQTQLRTDIVAQEAELARVKARINALLAREAGAPLAEPERLRPLPPPAHLRPADLEERLRARNPRLAAERSRLAAAEQGVRLANLDRYPDFTLGLAPIQAGSHVGSWELMLEVNIPWQQDTRRAQEREALAKAEAARARREAVANDAYGALAESLAALEAARRTESLADRTLLPQAELTFQSAVAGYENGKVDFATLLDAQRQIRRAKQERLKARAEAQARLADIERIVGEEP